MEVAAAAGRVGRLADAAALDDPGLLETLVNHQQRCVVTQVPLAEDPGAITSRTFIISARVTSSGCIWDLPRSRYHDPMRKFYKPVQEAGAGGGEQTMRRKTT